MEMGVSFEEEYKKLKEESSKGKLGYEVLGPSNIELFKGQEDHKYFIILVDNDKKRITKLYFDYWLDRENAIKFLSENIVKLRRFWY